MVLANTAAIELQIGTTLYKMSLVITRNPTPSIRDKVYLYLVCSGKLLKIRGITRGTFSILIGI